MGGRGAGSGRGRSALDTKDVGELRQYMRDHCSVTVHSSADKVDFGFLRSAACDLEGLLKEFPQAAIGIHELNGSESRSNAYASSSLSGKLQLNPKMMRDQVTAQAAYILPRTKSGICWKARWCSRTSRRPAITGLWIESAHGTNIVSLRRW